MSITILYILAIIKSNYKHKIILIMLYGLYYTATAMQLAMKKDGTFTLSFSRCCAWRKFNIKYTPCQFNCVWLNHSSKCSVHMLMNVMTFPPYQSR